MIGPIKLSVVGDEFTDGARISVIIWTGSSTAADTAVIVDTVSGNEIWKGQTDTTDTYLGGNFGPKGIHCPNGFRLSQISSGDVYVYLMED